ncbi:MAG: hypothetical protein GW748_00760 [Alphaproteobacteria bacterium]|nr:hypothetical protein [Alphaproteobacteria bacterium]NCQ66264.1 hypothetical protein [Alphaproteobacteria bacterium]NCT06612.1 hypothetical protein [Alphaproteobacteria bacterium]
MFFKKKIFFLLIIKQLSFVYACDSLATLDLEKSLPSCTAQSFQRPKDISSEAGIERLKEIRATCLALEDFIPNKSLNLFLGRSVNWFAATQTYRFEKSHSTHKGLWKAVHFSGGSSLTEVDDDTFYTAEELNGYKEYLCSLNITPETITQATGGIYLIDFILMGRTMRQFSKILTDWCAEEMPLTPLPTINFIDISFTRNYRDNFDHELILSPPPTQFLLSPETMNPFIHAKGEDDIGKDHSLLCSFTPDSWINWESVLSNYQPTKKTLAMHKELKQYLKHFR